MRGGAEGLDESYLQGDEIASLKQQGWRVHHLLNGYIRYLRNRKASGAVTLEESPAPYGIADDELDVIVTDEPSPRMGG